MDQSEDVRESERERCETLHDVVATTHACDRFVVRNPSAWHSRHSRARRRDSRAGWSAVAPARPTVRDRGWFAKKAKSIAEHMACTEAPECASCSGHPREAERNHCRAHAVQAPHVGGNMLPRQDRQPTLPIAKAPPRNKRISRGGRSPVLPLNGSAPPVQFTASLCRSKQAIGHRHSQSQRNIVR
jgi:hypothetical protein